MVFIRNKIYKFKNKKYIYVSACETEERRWKLESRRDKQKKLTSTT